jgi:hypothetical protein
MGNRAGRLRSLFITAYGYRNAVPYLHCESASLAKEIPIPTSSTTKGTYRGSYLYLWYISNPDYNHGLCANCAYYLYPYSWTKEATLKDPFLQALRATDTSSDDRLTFPNVPRYAKGGRRQRLPPRPIIKTIPTTFYSDLSMEILRLIRDIHRALAKKGRKPPKSIEEVYKRVISILNSTKPRGTPGLVGYS